MNVSVLVPGRYLLVSGGDDSALHAAELDLVLNDDGVTTFHVIRSVSEPSAHTSSVTGNDTVQTRLNIRVFLFLKTRLITNLAETIPRDLETADLFSQSMVQPGKHTIEHRAMLLQHFS